MTAKVSTFTAEVVLEQHYFNDSDGPLEVEYKVRRGERGEGRGERGEGRGERGEGRGERGEQRRDVHKVYSFLWTMEVRFIISK